jgi:N-acetylmuramoyl-L-alanine amidase CwlA
MTINKRLCPAGLKNNPNKNLAAVKYIPIHCTGNYAATAGAKNHAEYIYGGSGGTQTSWHYTIDSKEIWQHFEDTRACWHAGDGANGPGNTTSIALEICVNDKASFKKACENAAWLTAELLKKHGLAVDRVVQHNKRSGKNCPAELRSGAWGVTWAAFISMVKKELEARTASPASVPAASGKLYRVCVGAYVVKANADTMLAKAKAAGFKDAYIHA